MENLTEVKIEDVKVGTGVEVAVGDNITVHYVGTTADGTVFDSSRQRGEPITFGLNPGQLIQGWIEGIPGMKEGGVRKLVIPGPLAYGENPPPGAGFGANATLYFEVELIAVSN
ncbi:MAG: peptidylprolyl isomerase [Candidatus Harrisonbacteria bacterium CG10_big_fil_rev_8_21_14_0_10_45_28]|uniref:Peptidyl-prolyl cis-trans isomerase n=1 Tax=Candidatus Harrisonbacteria bacterium CG10_big_fil_rev_8_21_14_0_10_45_28 TaxID=1974586 RepID=A0A2H0UMH1_9BACT|nr:MAG: peptidylprolyl isomerase [Candidatus Harrisonbacteria bacterium CG10_big_fil_rev_8_21_14_0_10_45_28]